MGSYAVYTKWYHEKGVKPADEMAQGMRDAVSVIQGPRSMAYG